MKMEIFFMAWTETHEKPGKPPEIHEKSRFSTLQLV
jgi:hypothetical protein